MSNPVEWQSWDVYFGTERMHVVSYTKTTDEAYVLACVKQDFPRFDVTIKKQESGENSQSNTEHLFEVWWNTNYARRGVSPYVAAKAAWAFLCIK